MGWVKATLLEILPVKYGKARSKQFGHVREKTATYGSNGVFGTFDRTLTTKSAIIIGRKGAAGAVHYSPEPCWPIDTAFYAEENDRTYLPFFRYLLESLQLGALDRSTAIPSLSRDDYNAKTICYPESVAEQRRIVAEIERQFTRLETGMAALRRVQANLHRYRAAVLKAACSGRLLPTRGGRDPTRLGEVCTVLAGYGFPKSLQGRTTGDIPFFKVGDISEAWQHNDQTLTTAKHYISHKEVTELRARPLPAGAVVFAKIGAAIALNRRAILGQPSLVDNNVIGLQPGNCITSKFLFFFVCTLKLNELARATTVPSIRKGDVEGIAINLPLIAEQDRIVAEVERRLSVVDELSALVTANLKRADRLRQSILKQAFEGKLVAQEQAVTSANVVMPKPAQNKPRNRHFVRALLSAEIIHQLHAEPTFGRIKHQKIFHLCEHIARIEEIQGQYYREAAGPLDNRLIYTNEDELKKQKWYQTVPRKRFGHAYEPMTKAGGHRKYLERYWPDTLPLIERLIKLMRSWDTDRCEIFSTAYAAWNDLILWNKEPTEDAILDEILNRWHDRKKRFPPERWHKAIAWMRKEGFVPTGFGKPTKKRSCNSTTKA